MSDYTRITNFTAKDSLPSGNTGKVIKGVDFDAEFDALVTAIATKANSNSASLIGTPTTPTAVLGTNTTQIASTAFVAAAVSASAGIAASGGTMTGLLDLFTTTNRKAVLSSAVVDLATGTVFSYTLSSSQTFTFVNTPATANASSGFVIQLTNGGSAAITWPAFVKWPNALAPTLTAAGIDVLVFITLDNGVTWRGAVAMLKSS